MGVSCEKKPRPGQQLVAVGGLALVGPLVVHSLTYGIEEMESDRTPRGVGRVVAALRECHQSGAWDTGDLECCMLLSFALTAAGLLVLFFLAHYNAREKKARKKTVDAMLLCHDRNQPRKSLVPKREDSEHASPLTVVLDLDETLISFGDDAYDRCGAKGVRHRPGLVALGQYLRELGCEVIVWTAATKGYTKAVFQSFNRVQLQEGALTAHHTVTRNTGTWYDEVAHVKDLSLLDRDLSRVVMIENRAQSCLEQKENSILVPDFDTPQCKRKRGPGDDILCQVVSVLKDLARNPDVDVRSVLPKCRLLNKIPASSAVAGEQKGRFFYLGDKFARERPVRG
eukprot:Hpha_TRINITY_DN14622_c0_g3::TRINITY_DN14622_c0_g3_i1::g.48114::m.48114/K17496/TIM50; mitochondrial import inner membrane translocase subunit TIM50